MRALGPARLQDAAEAAAEGLPFWILWFLLCVILMLIVFIVLRDKDLRARMSSFLSGARRKMLRLRLQAKVRKEEAKRIGLLRSLGEKAWELDLADEKAEPVRARLQEIEERIHLEQIKWHGHITEIDGLNGRLQETRRKFEESLHRQEDGRRPLIEEMTALMARRESLMESFGRAKEELEAARNEAGSLEKEVLAARQLPHMRDGDESAKIEKIRDASASLGKWIKETQGNIALHEEEQERIDEAQKNLQSRIDLINEEIRRLDAAYRSETKGLEDVIRAKEADKRRTERGLIALKESMAPLYVNLGKVFEASRLPHVELELVYLELDLIRTTILDLEFRIEKLE